MRFVWLTVCLAIPLAAAEKVTTGPPKLIAESDAREGPSWDPFTGTLYFVSGNNVNELENGISRQPVNEPMLISLACMTPGLRHASASAIAASGVEHCVGLDSNGTLSL